MPPPCPPRPHRSTPAPQAAKQQGQLEPAADRGAQCQPNGAQTQGIRRLRDRGPQPAGQPQVRHGDAIEDRHQPRAESSRDHEAHEDDPGRTPRIAEREEHALQQPRGTRRQQAQRVRGQHQEHEPVVVEIEGTPSIHGADDSHAQRQVPDQRRRDEEGHRRHGPFGPVCRRFRPFLLVPLEPRQLRQFRRRHRNAEQRDGQQVQPLAPAQDGNRSLGQERGQETVDIAPELTGAPAGNRRPEPAQRLPQARRPQVERRAQPTGRAQHRRQLHGELQQAAEQPAPTGGQRERFHAVRFTAGHPRGDEPTPRRSRWRSRNRARCRGAENAGGC